MAVWIQIKLLQVLWNNQFVQLDKKCNKIYNKKLITITIKY